MDTQIQVRIGNVDSPLRSMSVGDLVDRLEQTNKLLESLGFKSGRVSWIQSPSEAWTKGSPSTRSIDYQFTVQGTTSVRRIKTASPSVYAYGEGSIRDLIGRLMAGNKSNIISLLDKKRMSSRRAVLAEFLPGDELRMSVVVVPSRQCSRCGKTVTKVTQIHQNSEECLRLYNQRTYPKIGMVLIEQADLRSALYNTPGVDIKHAPVQYELWAPKWVDAAYKMWQSGDSTFNELTLAELLKQMNPVDAPSESK